MLRLISPSDARRLVGPLIPPRADRETGAPVSSSYYYRFIRPECRTYQVGNCGWIPYDDLRLLYPELPEGVPAGTPVIRQEEDDA